MNLLSIIVPVYNEEAYIAQLLNKLERLRLTGDCAKEIIIVDDGSTDRTGKQVADFIKAKDNGMFKYLIHEKNMGKGVAIRTGIGAATGNMIVIQDADLEYNPAELNILMDPVLNNRADVVYGSRFKGSSAHRVLFFWHYVGNRFLTFLSNMLTNLNLSDMETCYKLFRDDVLKSIRLREDRFGIEPEITAKISRIPDIRIFEVGISYNGRTYRDGKKINWKDGVRALYCIIKYNVFQKR
jgi:glycosyltransferase involved in cell wall biosynthesis